MEITSSRPDATDAQDPGAPSSKPVLIAIPREPDPEWEEAFHWSYSPRLWNVGCG